MYSRCSVVHSDCMKNVNRNFVHIPMVFVLLSRRIFFPCPFPFPSPFHVPSFVQDERIAYVCAIVTSTVEKQHAKLFEVVYARVTDNHRAPRRKDRGRIFPDIPGHSVGNLLNQNIYM